MYRLSLPVLLLTLACKGGPATDKEVEQVGDEGSGDEGNGDEGSDGTPATPDRIELSLSTLVTDINTPVTASVIVYDTDGAVITEPYTLSVSPPDGVTLAGDTLTFAAEGTGYTVTATLSSDAAITDVEGPLIADENPPLITLTSPARGAVATAETLQIDGLVTDAASGVASLTVDGAPVEVAADGSFSALVPLSPGANTPQLIATDPVGHSADLSLGTLWGSFTDPVNAVTRALLVQLNDDALDTLGGAAIGFLDEATLEDALIASNPIVNTSISCYTLKVNVTSFTMGATTLDLDPEPGQLLVTALIEDIAIGLNSRFTPCAGSVQSYPGEITIGSTQIDAALSFDVPAVGDVNATLDDISATTTDVNVDLGGLTTLLSAFGITLSSLGIDVGALIEDEIVASLSDVLPDAFADTLSSVSFAESFDLLGAIADMSAGVSAVELSADALTLVMDATLTAPTSDEVPAIAGALWLEGADPAFEATPDTHIDLSANLMNRLLHAAWAAGALNQDLNAADLGLDPALIALLFPGATTLDLTLRAGLPPVVGEADGSGIFSFTMPEMSVVAVGEVDGVATELANAMIQVEGLVQASVDGPEIAITIEDLAFTADQLSTDPTQTAADEALEEKLSTLAGLLLTDLFPTIPLSLPALGPVVFTGESVAPGGSPALWAVIGGTLTAG
jgi:hypothetical protein